jgi:hypothetical protein
MPASEWIFILIPKSDIFLASHEAPPCQRNPRPSVSVIYKLLCVAIKFLFRQKETGKAQTGETLHVYVPYLFACNVGERLSVYIYR